MRWLKRDIWKVGIIIIGVLFFLLLFMGLPLSTVSQQRSIGGAATPIPKCHLFFVLCKPIKLGFIEQLIQQLLPGCMSLLSWGNHLQRHPYKQFVHGRKFNYWPKHPRIFE